MTPRRTLRLTYPFERAERVAPALCPERVALGQVSLGQAPSLHRLRSRFHGFVRQLRRYYGPVRLPTSVHHRRASFDFPIRSAASSAADARGISRFSHKVLACMRRVSDRAGSLGALPWRRLGCGLPTFSNASAPRSNPPFGGRLISRLDTGPTRTPVNASPAPSRAPTHDLGPVWVASPLPYETSIHNTLPI